MRTALTDEVFEIEPEYDPGGTESVILLNGGEPVDNQPLLGRVEISKTDAVGGQPFPGC